MIVKIIFVAQDYLTKYLINVIQLIIYTKFIRENTTSLNPTKYIFKKGWETCKNTWDYISLRSQRWPYN